MLAKYVSWQSDDSFCFEICYHAFTVIPDADNAPCFGESFARIAEQVAALPASVKSAFRRRDTLTSGGIVMSNTIGSAGAGFSAMMGGTSGMQRPDPTKMVDKIFSKLDSKGQGYIEKSDLQSAFDQVSSRSSSSNIPSVDDVFKVLDNNSDGKVTKQEMSDSIKKLADQLDTQFQGLRMNGHGGGMHVTGMAGSAMGSASQMLSTLAQNFDAADTNQDGKISAQEAMAYQASSETLSSSDAQGGEARVMARIMELMASYGAFGQDEQISGSTISTAA